MKKLTIFLLVAVLLLGVSAIAGATVVTLEDTSQTTLFTATVAEQADVTVPADVAFSVRDVSIPTASEAQSVTVTQIVLNNLQGIKISLKADAASFTYPTGGLVTWDASDVSWNAATWSNGTGTEGTLNIDTITYTEVAHSTANPATFSTANLVFTLDAKDTVDRAGDHTLAATWKFESFTP